MSCNICRISCIFNFRVDSFPYFITFRHGVSLSAMSSVTSPTRRVKARNKAPSENETTSHITAPNRYQTSAGPAPGTAQDRSLSNVGHSQMLAHNKNIEASRSMRPSSVLDRTQPSTRRTMLSESRGGPHYQNYPQFLSLPETLTLQLGFLWAGLRDAFRWELVAKLLLSSVFS
jgi:hypothetical protein